MSQFCSACGQRARDDDRHCVSCGAPMSSAAGSAPPTHQPFRAPDGVRHRTGRFVVAHAKGLMALAVIAVIGIVAAVSGSSSNNDPRPEDVAPTPAAAADPTPRPKARTTSTTSAARSVSIRGAGGHHFSCPSRVLDRVDTADARVKRRKQVLKTRRAEARAIERRYPGRTAPSAVVDRYKTVIRGINAQVDLTNNAIDEYNRTLADACTRG